MMQLRLAGRDDLAGVMALAGNTPEAAQWAASAYETYVAEEQAAVRRCLLVAEVDGTLAGFAAAAWLTGEESAELENLAVYPASRRRGVARVLCEGLKAWAEGLGIARLALEVRESNLAARGLYARLGFTDEGRRRSYYSGPSEDAVLMTWRLDPERRIQDL